MNISKEFKVGLMALVGMVALYFGFNFLKGSDFFSSTYDYHAKYDNVGLLAVSNPVKVNGVIVGRVNEINLLTEDNNKVEVVIEINKSLSIPKNSIAFLKSDGLLGGMVIDVKLGQSSSFLKSGDKITSKVEKDFMTKMQAEAPSMMKRVDSIAYRIDKLLMELDGVGLKVGKTIDTYNQMGGTLNSLMLENKRNIAGITGNFKTLSASLIDTEKKFKPVIGKFSSFADSLKTIKLTETVANANNSIKKLNVIMDKINSGKGTLGALINDDSLYNNLNRMSIDLDKLLIDLRKHPRRYIKLSVF